MQYFVERVLHNAVANSFDFKQTKRFDTLDEAEKEFHNILGTYINYGKLDRVSVILFDENCNPIAHKSWERKTPIEVPEEPAEEPAEN